MRIKHLLPVLPFAAILLVASVSYAAYLTAQPAAGYCFSTGDHSCAGITRSEGRVSSVGGGVWATPFQLSVYNVNYSGVQSTDNYDGTPGYVESRLVSYDKDGNYSMLSGGGADNHIGTVFVPINGTLHMLSYFTSSCPANEPCQVATLRSTKVTY